MYKHILWGGGAVVLLALLIWGGRQVGLPDQEAQFVESLPNGTESVNEEQAAAPQQKQPSSTDPQTPSMHHLVTITTALGIIKFQTYDADASKTVENFITLANKGFYNGVIFHRVIPGFMIQGGDPTGTGAGGPEYQFADELDPNTPSAKEGYKKGVVAMANAGPNTNGSQFFIMHADYPLPHSYTIFGKVVEGQDVVDKIATAPRGAQDRPNTPVAMQTVTVEEAK